MTLPVAVFASGSGSNLQALLDHESTAESYRVDLVVSDRPDATALERARSHGREVRVVEVSGRERAEVANETSSVLAERDIQAILLAGYLRLVPGSVVEAYRKRILNVHPALLPAFGGKGMFGRRIHEAVLRAGVRVTGVTIHYVDESYDTGSILAQWPVPVKRDDTARSLAARVLSVEHVLYPLVAEHLCRALAEGGDPASFEYSGSAFATLDPESSDPCPGGIAEAFTQEEGQR